MTRFKLNFLGAVLCFGLSQNAQANTTDNLPIYQPASGISGNLSSIGSDTLNNLMTLWSEDFKRFHPSVNVQVQGMGSSTAPPALAEGTAQLGPMSRMMKDSEIAEFESKFGYRPTPIRVALDALAVFVNKDNPVKGLTLTQVDAIYTNTRRCGLDKPIERWGDVGLTDGWAQRPIQLFGRNSVSGTYGYFKEAALCKGDFKADVNEQPGSASVVQSVGASLNAIGYSGIGYKTSAVRLLPLAKKEGSPYVAPTTATALDGSYPLTRFLVVYVNKAPNKPIDPMVKAFLTLVLSQQGQRTVIKDGYIALPKSVIEKELAKLQ